MLINKLIKLVINRIKTKIIPTRTAEERKDLYGIVHFLGISIFLFCVPLGLVDFLFKIKTIYKLPETIGWVGLPLMFVSIPIALLLFNFTFYLMVPIRNFFNRVSKENDLPIFQKANKQLVKALLLLAGPLLLQILLIVLLSCQGYSNEIVGLFTIVSTIGIPLYWIKKLEK